MYHLPWNKCAVRGSHRDGLNRLLKEMTVHCAYPDASRVKDKNGRCPLYYIRQATPLAFVEQLIMAWPQAAQERDDDGQLPLHVALEARASLEVLSYLLASYPSVTMTEG